MAKRTTNGIGSIGVRENADGSFTVQMAKRSEQLNGIADAIRKAFDAGTEDHGPLGKMVRLDRRTAHTLKGFMNTLEIIADELKSIGK